VKVKAVRVTNCFFAVMTMRAKRSTYLCVPMVSFVFLWLSGGCSAGEATFLNREKLAAIKTWMISYSYETGMDEPATWVQERTTLPSRLPQSNLNLGVAIYFRLKERFGVGVTREEMQADGLIRLHAINFLTGGCKVLYVTMYDRSGEVLAQTRIYPDFRKPNFSYSDSFPEDAAANIADLLARSRNE
jgi:hypothetical protein